MTRVWRWFTRRSQRKARDIDLRYLWPALKILSPDLRTARAAFALHAFRDNPWRALGENEITRIIETLT